MKQLCFKAWCEHMARTRPQPQERLTIQAPFIRGASSRWGVGAGVSPFAVAFLPSMSCRCRATYSKRFCRTCMKAQTAVRTTNTRMAEKMRVSWALAAVEPYAYPGNAQTNSEQATAKKTWARFALLLTHMHVLNDTLQQNSCDGCSQAICIICQCTARESDCDS